MDIPPAGTILTLLFFPILGLIPVIPALARVVVLIVVGLGIYFGLDAAFFNLPNGDNMAISALFGGTGGTGGFNKLAMGFVGPVLGLLAVIVSVVLAKVFGKKE